MNGGTFSQGVEKVRPGIYFNFAEVARERVEVGERGRVILPLSLPWGPVGEFVSLSSPQDALRKFQTALSDPSFLPAREALKGAMEVIVYRINEGTAASATISGGADAGLTVTAQYTGSLGNDIQLSITESLSDSSKKSVKTYLKGNQVDEQIVANSSELVENPYVKFSGSAELEDTASVKLTQGADGTAANGDFATFLERAEYQAFDVAALPLSDESLKATFVAFIKNLRENKGKKVQGVVADYNDANYEGIINVVNGVVLEDGTELSAELVTAFVAGMSAGSTYTRSLTFMNYPGAVDILGGPNGNDEIVEALNAGKFFFVLDPRDSRVSVEQDINSLQSVNSVSRKNKVVRLKDAIQNDLTLNLKRTIATRKEAGIDIPANADGEQIVTSMIIEYMNIVAENGGIQEFDAETDVLVAVTDQGDGFNIELAITPVDAAEKFYFNVEVR